MNELQSRLNQPLLKYIRARLPQDVPIYLVGGAVRDALLDRTHYDLDFSTPGEAMKIARRLANELGAAYFPLDPIRKVARLVLNPDKRVEYAGAGPIKIDFSAYQGADLTADLMGRDFTINAMAVEVQELQTLVDPTGGANDLVARRLRLCSPSALLDDPVRILRGVRFSVDMGLTISPETLQHMREASSDLPKISAERLRDELFRILMITHPATSLRILDKLGALEYILPEVCSLKVVQQSQPHVMDAWNHTLDVLNRLESVLEQLCSGPNPDKAENLTMGLVTLYLGQYRKQLTEHLENSLNPDRPHRGLIFLAGLYHDVGKKNTQSVDAQGKIRFLGHDQAGGRLVEKCGQELRLSKQEIDRLFAIVSHHMRPSLLSHPEEKPSRKSIYHFFRDTGVAGVDICILSLADVLATYGVALPQDRWIRHLEVIQTLLGAWWEARAERVFPVPVINGEELMQALDLVPGPLVGYLLEAIREAQITLEIHDQQGAIDLARKIIQEDINKKTG